MMKLHIGGKEEREGWKILDVLPGPAVDYVGNCNDLSFLQDGSCAEIYASHVLEHLGYDGEIQRTLAGFYRVLKPGGWLRVSVPDLPVLCKLFLHPQLGPSERFRIMRIMFGGRTDEYDIHCTGLYFELLRDFLNEAGFSDIRRVEEFDLFADASKLRFGGDLISLNVQALKPA